MGSAEQRFLTLEQLHALADAAEAHRPLGYVLGTCGLRFGKVAELRWRDLDLQKKQIRIARSVTLVDEVFKIGSPKNGKGCTVSLPAFVAELLRVQGVVRTSNFTSIPGEPDALVLPTPRVGICGVATFGGRGGPRPSRREQTTVSDFKVHELRHTTASLADPGRRRFQGAAERAGTRVRGPDVGPLRPPVRVGRGGRREVWSRPVLQLWLIWI